MVFRTKMSDMINWKEYVWAGPKGAMYCVSCRLYSSSPQPPPRQCLTPTCHLSARGAEPPPLLLHVATASKNQLNEKITPFLPTGIGERYCQTILNKGHAPLLSRCVTVCISLRKSLISKEFGHRKRLSAWLSCQLNDSIKQKKVYCYFSLLLGDQEGDLSEI